MTYFDPEYNPTYTFKRYSLGSGQMEILFFESKDISDDIQQLEYMLDVEDFDPVESWLGFEDDDGEFKEKTAVYETVNAVMAEAKLLGLDYVEFV